ncbi:hypothetical protein FNF31_06953 [Cafeteria roenbergensis]|uniref:Solute-binding protein family 3/N-terminal domain-containing protein n=1 Tax=Cafeteria roenbergensis TaxID=33653 RepID=A0A5A8CCY9_CAFRO|nr:hypothetical protein FNF31_06953 [Cafeteria roenbergensis]KAA0171540.1 hypothetical protein FNF28_00750 [Cafeteria roenbergensis]
MAKAITSVLAAAVFAIGTTADMPPATLGAGDTQLAQVIDFAIAKVTADGTLLAAKTRWDLKTVAALTCAASPDAYTVPAASDSVGALREVLDTGYLQIAALGPADWGVDGNYELDPPVGFWPDYVAGIAKAIADKYSLGRVQVNRTFYPSSTQVLDAVRTRRHHLTEPYFNTGAFYRGVPRRVGMHASCSVLGYDSTFFVNSSTGIASAAALASAVNGRPVGALSEGDWHAVAPVLPQGTPFQVYGSSSLLEQAVTNGEVFAGVVSGDPSANAGFTAFSSDVVTLRSFLLPAQRMPTPCPSPPASSAHAAQPSAAALAVLAAVWFWSLRVHG